MNGIHWRISISSSAISIDANEYHGCSSLAQLLIGHQNQYNAIIKDEIQIRRNMNSYLDDLQKILLQHPTIGRKRAILVSIFSYCPIHKGHLNIFGIAARFLLENYPWNHESEIRHFYVTKI